jgi:hypothetical protein
MVVIEPVVVVLGLTAASLLKSEPVRRVLALIFRRPRERDIVVHLKGEAALTIRLPEGGSSVDVERAIVEALEHRGGSPSSPPPPDDNTATGNVP